LGFPHSTQLQPGRMSALFIFFALVLTQHQSLAGLLDYQVSLIEFSPIELDSPDSHPFDIVTSNPNDDGGTHPIDIPFPFVFYNVSYTQLSVCTNGWLWFGGRIMTQNEFDEYEGESIPDNGGASNLLAFYWTDLDNANVKTQLVEKDGDRRFVINFFNGNFTVCESFRTVQSHCGPIDVQIQLVESSNNLEVHYINAEPDPVSQAMHSGDALTIAVESLDYHHYTIYQEGDNIYSRFSYDFPSFTGKAIVFTTDNPPCYCPLNHVLSTMPAFLLPYPI